MSPLITPPTSAPVLSDLFRGGLDEEDVAEVKEEEDVAELGVVGSGNHVCVCVVSRKCGHLVVHKTACYIHRKQLLTLSSSIFELLCSWNIYYLVNWVQINKFW